MSKVKNVLKLFLLSLFVLSFLRLILFLSYPNDFSSLNLQEIILSFLMGIRVDIISLCISLALIILILFLPFKFICNRKVQITLYSFWYIILSLIVLVQIGDIVYFEHVHRHIANEIVAMQNDMHVVFDMAKVHYLKVLAFIAFEIVLFFIFRKLLNFDIKQENFSLKSIGLLFLIIVVLFLGIRNKIQGKPFGLSDAFVTNKTASGNLAISGFFSIVKTVSKKQKIYHFYEQNEALQKVKSNLKSDEFSFISDEYPILRKVNNPENKKHNVVIVMLESWSAKYIDSFSNNNLNVTKNFDDLASKGLMFTNFFANGQRSIDGITALLTGIPTMPGFNYLGKGLELSNFSYLGNSAKNNNYSTLAMQSSKRGSFRIDSIMNLAGFDEYYGAEDIPSLNIEKEGAKPRFGTWDNNMLSFYLEKINSLKEPFLSFAFTSTTHIPFISPGKKWEKYEHNENNIYGYLNTLNYADDALGRFMDNAKKQKWFDNTIFVFLADHTIGFGDDSSMFKGTNIKIKNRSLENMRIPLLIYAPKIFKEAKKIDKLSSQADILPSLAHYLGWKGNIASFSNSVFSSSNEEFVLFSYGNILGYVNNNGYIKHTLDKSLENTLGKDGEKNALSFYQVLSNTIRFNKIVP